MLCCGREATVLLSSLNTIVRRARNTSVILVGHAPLARSEPSARSSAWSEGRTLPGKAGEEARRSPGCRGTNPFQGTHPPSMGSSTWSTASSSPRPGSSSAPVLGTSSMQPAEQLPQPLIEGAVSSSDEVAVTVAEDATPIEPSAQTECVICLGELVDPNGTGEGEPTTTLVCGHAFHTSCVDEWLSKDGRCPTCRRQIQEVVQRPQPTLSVLDGSADRASLQSMSILMLDSRRLMMLATMEAALAVRCSTHTPSPSALGSRIDVLRCSGAASLAPDCSHPPISPSASQVLVMSYVSDLLSPALMILAAAVTFVGASHYLSRCIGAARPVLAINALYHVYLMAHIFHQQQGIPFFSDEYGSYRTILLSLGCVTVMEVRSHTRPFSCNHGTVVAQPPTLLPRPPPRSPCAPSRVVRAPFVPGGHSQEGNRLPRTPCRCPGRRAAHAAHLAPRTRRLGTATYCPHHVCADLRSRHCELCLWRWS